MARFSFLFRRFSQPPAAGRGFSLMEIVVVVALIALSLIAIVSVAQKILQVEHVTENDFVAKGLLLEGVELAEAVRNANVSNARPFYETLTVTTPTNGISYSMIIDYLGANSTVTNLTDAAARLKYDVANFYQHSTGDDTKFYRRLVTTYRNVGGRDYLDVESQVYWSDRGRGYTQKMDTKLLNTNY